MAIATELGSIGSAVEASRIASDGKLIRMKGFRIILIVLRKEIEEKKGEKTSDVLKTLSLIVGGVTRMISVSKGERRSASTASRPYHRAFPLHIASRLSHVSNNPLSDA
jgi:hypothetical protein